MSETLYELFTLKCSPIKAALDAAVSPYDSGRIGAGASLQSDPMIREYISQISLEDRLQAERMAEYYKIFYVLENHIRDFIDNILDADTQPGEDWWETRVPPHIVESARKSRERELAAGVTPRSAEMIEYITFGELVEIIRANNAQFAGYFTNMRGFEGVMARLNTLRGPIMHCGVLAEDEVVRLKLSVRDWFKLFDAR